MRPPHRVEPPAHCDTIPRVPQPSTSKSSPRLTRRFYRRDPVTVARALLGKTLVRHFKNGRRAAGTIVETEAYLGAPDRAAHAYNHHHTPRNHSMYLDGGAAYVYFTYGMHFCCNIVTQTADVPTACLIRALQPTEGLDLMRRNRAGKIPADRLRDTDLASGPAKLCQALNITRDLDAQDLTQSPHLTVERGPTIPPSQITRAPRVGIAYAEQWTDKPLRFFITANPHVSVPHP